MIEDSLLVKKLWSYQVAGLFVYTCLVNLGIKQEKFNEIPIKEMRADSLTELNLARKHIGVAGCMVVAGLVSANTSLTSIDFSYNAMNADEAKALAAAVAPIAPVVVAMAMAAVAAMAAAAMAMAVAALTGNAVARALMAMRGR